MPFKIVRFRSADSKLETTLRAACTYNLKRRLSLVHPLAARLEVPVNGMTKDNSLYMSAVLRKQVAAVRQATVTASINDRAVLLAEAEALDREIIALEANEGRRQIEKKG